MKRSSKIEQTVEIPSRFQIDQSSILFVLLSLYVHVCVCVFMISQHHNIYSVSFKQIKQMDRVSFCHSIQDTFFLILSIISLAIKDIYTHT